MSVAGLPSADPRSKKDGERTASRPAMVRRLHERTGREIRRRDQLHARARRSALAKRHDSIPVVRVMADELDSEFWQSLRVRLKKELGQG